MSNKKPFMLHGGLLQVLTWLDPVGFFLVMADVETPLPPWRE
jgi:hypothetical protein